jgi:hypothetical protein
MAKRLGNESEAVCWLLATVVVCLGAVISYQFSAFSIQLF